MLTSLAPCPSCARHVKTSEATCPFCKSGLSASCSEGAIPAATVRLSRAAAFAFTASLAVVGCGSTTSPPVGDAGSSSDGAALDSGGIQPAYGGVPIDAAIEIPDAASDGPQDSGSPAALYGAPIQDPGHSVTPIPD